MEKGVLKNLAKFTGKHLCQSLFFNKIVVLRAVTLLKNRLWNRYFPVDFAKFLEHLFFRTRPGDCCLSSGLTLYIHCTSFLYSLIPLSFLTGQI